VNGLARWVTALLLWISVCAQSAEPGPALAERYHALLKELRCLVCQNESLNESNADLAQDLRAKIQSMMKEGATDAQIVVFLTARYGDFILYRPPVKPMTYLLWFAPFLLVVAALAALLRRIHQRARDSDHPLSPQEQRRLREVLGEGQRK
jgi:cytochrome c-type biogenesis protein CcmH